MDDVRFPSNWMASVKDSSLFCFTRILYNLENDCLQFWLLQRSLKNNYLNCASSLDQLFFSKRALNKLVFYHDDFKLIYININFVNVLLSSGSVGGKYIFFNFIFSFMLHMTISHPAQIIWNLWRVYTFAVFYRS
jgi:hypothetical protein